MKSDLTFAGQSGCEGISSHVGQDAATLHRPPRQPPGGREGVMGMDIHYLGRVRV